MLYILCVWRGEPGPLVKRGEGEKRSGGKKKTIGARPRKPTNSKDPRKEFKRVVSFVRGSEAVEP